MELSDLVEPHISGADIRGFLAISDSWALSEGQRASCLGAPSEKVYRAWTAAALPLAEIVLPREVLLRISAMLGIHAALQVMFSPGAEARDWLRHGRISGGERRRAPLDCITGGDLDDMMLVRRHLEAWCAGHVGAAGPAGAYEAVTEEMIDFR